MHKSQIKGSSKEEQKKHRGLADKATDEKNTHKQGRAAKNEGRNGPVTGDVSGDTRREVK